MLLGLGHIVANSRHSKHSVLVPFVRNVPEPMSVSGAKIVIWSHFVFVCLTLETLACVPLVGLHPHPKHMISLKLLLPQVHWLSQLVLFAVHEIVLVAFDKYSL